MAVRKVNYTWKVRFKGRHETFEQVFGRKPLCPMGLTKKMWNFIRKHKLLRRMKRES